MTTMQADRDIYTNTFCGIQVGIEFCDPLQHDKAGVFLFIHASHEPAGLTTINTKICHNTLIPTIEQLTRLI
jgi:hypothetical protein